MVTELKNVKMKSNLFLMADIFVAVKQLTGFSDSISITVHWQ